MADGTLFDTLELLQIDIIAARMAIEIDEDAPPASLFTDELIGRAIAEHFSECEDWKDDLIPVAVREYRAAKGLHALGRDLAFSLMGGIMGAWAA